MKIWLLPVLQELPLLRAQIWSPPGKGRGRSVRRLLCGIDRSALLQRRTGLQLLLRSDRLMHETLKHCWGSPLLRLLPLLQKGRGPAKSSTAEPLTRPQKGCDYFLRFEMQGALVLSY